jgi:hypothetical protein
MKLNLHNLCGAGLIALACVGCADNTAPAPGTRSTTTTTTTTTTAPPVVEHRAARVDPDREPVDVHANTNGPKANVRSDNGRTDVQVGDKTGRPAVDVDVAPGGGVNVDVDRDRIRERVQERREQRELDRTR